MKKIIKWLRSHRIIYTVVVIGAIYLGVALVSYLAMAVGTRHGMKRTVPDFVGLQLSDAGRFADRRGLEIVVTDSLYVPAYPGGMVLDQLPEGGVDVKSGRKIYVTINSSRQKMVPLPYVAGRSLRQAKNMLEAAGLTIRELRYMPDIATNYVLAQFVDGVEITAETKRSVEMGSGVTLDVGVAEGSAPATVPNLLGRPLVEARGKLWESGLNVGDVVYDQTLTMVERNAARVVSQSVAAGGSVGLGSRVSFHLTTDMELVAAAEKEYAHRMMELEKARREQADSIAAAERLLDSLKALEPTSEPAAAAQQPEDEFFM